MGRPKAALEYRGETFLGRLVRIFGIYCEDVIVVDSNPGEVRGARTVLNPDPSRGMLSSLQCGMAAVGEAAAVCFTPVDYPAVSESTIAELVRGWAGEAVRIPRCEGRRGHPVVVARRLLAEFLALPTSAQARDVIQRYADEAVYVDVDDPGILRDVDTPAEYEQLR
jgi:molybdenum cofactor cytidylyltransferase